MIEYLRKFLIFIRKQSNRTDLNPVFEIRILIGIIIGVVGGIIIDVFLPYNFFLNMIRGVIANIVGFSIFSIAYVTNVKLRNKKIEKDNLYVSLRKRFSHQQRINLSILGGIILVLLILLTSKEGAAYTLKAGLAVTSILILLAFARSSRDEFIKNIFEIPDVRDLEFLSKSKEKQSEIKDEKVEDELLINQEPSKMKQKFELYKENKNKS